MSSPPVENTSGETPPVGAVDETGDHASTRGNVIRLTGTNVVDVIQAARTAMASIIPDASPCSLTIVDLTGVYSVLRSSVVPSTASPCLVTVSYSLFVVFSRRIVFHYSSGDRSSSPSGAVFNREGSTTGSESSRYSATPQ